MSRLIFVPQYPVPMRYQEWWFTEFPRKFFEYFDGVLVLRTKSYPQIRGDRSLFSPVLQSLFFEMVQVYQYTNLDTKKDDFLFLSDLSFPGLFINALIHKPLENAYAFCHATSKNAYDYFHKRRKIKYKIEKASSKLFKKVFVGSNYHRQKLGWKNIEVVGLPKPPFKTFREKKKYDIVSVARPSIQKVNKKLEKKIERRFGEIVRFQPTSWNSYYKFISQSRVLLVTCKEETFGYPVLESVMNNTIPIVPDKFCFREMLPDNYRYECEEDLSEKIYYFLRHPDEVPKLRNISLVDNFYESVVSIMKGDKNG